MREGLDIANMNDRNFRHAGQRCMKESLGNAGMIKRWSRQCRDE
jgi:hypothetical protein